MKIKMFTITIISLLPIITQATTYYLDGTLSSDCDGSSYHYDVSGRTRIEGPGQIAWNDLASANSTLKAGDTLYMRGGTSDYEVYNITAQSGPGEGIQPDNSGMSYQAMITYSTYNDEMVHLKGNLQTVDSYAKGILLHNKNYIKITGSAANYLKVSRCFRNLEISGDNPGSNYARYNEIAYVWATESYLADGDVGNYSYTTCVINDNTEYNWIHHCKFTRHGFSMAGNLFQVAPDPTWSDWLTAVDRFNIIEDCEFAYAGHAPLSPQGTYNIYRNNYIHNEAWTSVGQSFEYAFRGALGYGDYNGARGVIFEGNRVGHADRGPGSPYGTDGIDWAQSDGIIRYNAIFNNGADGIQFRAATYANNYYMRSNNNYLYNNTFYRNGKNEVNTALAQVVMLQYSPSYIDYHTGINIYWQACQDNVIKNNLFYDNFSNKQGESVYGGGDLTTAQACPSSQTQGCNIISNNYNDDAGENTDPKFVDTTLTSYDSWTLPNLNLQSDSPVIDQGAYLTQANGSGTSSQTLTVDDASYFQDGKFGSASGCDPTKWPSGVDIQADWIAIGTVDNIVQISSVNYTSKTIYLATGRTWSDGAEIWLYRKSDGEQVLYGTAPDYGAYENYSGGPPTGNVNDDGTPMQIREYMLSQNYPNPLNPSTTIRFEIPKQSEVTLKIYDMTGREVATLINDLINAGRYDVKFDASYLSSGVYFYRLKAGNFVQVKKLILMK